MGDLTSIQAEVRAGAAAGALVASPPYHTGAVYVFVRMNAIWSKPDPRGRARVRIRAGK